MKDFIELLKVILFRRVRIYEVIGYTPGYEKEGYIVEPRVLLYSGNYNHFKGDE